MDTLMDDYRKGPRRKRCDLNDIKDDKKRQIAFIVSGYITRSGLTVEQFANIPPKVSVAYLYTLFGSHYDSFPKPSGLRRLADKISTIFNEVDATELYNKLLLAGGYDINEYPYSKYNTTIKRPRKFDANTLIISKDEYNKLKEELLKANTDSLRATTVIKQLFQLARVTNNDLTWNSNDIATILKLAYPQEYHKLLMKG